MPSISATPARNRRESSRSWRRERGERRLDPGAPRRAAAGRAGDVLDRGDGPRHRLVALRAGLPSIGVHVLDRPQLVRLPRLEQLAAYPEHPLVRTEELVRRGGHEVGAEPVQIDQPVLRCVDAVERDERADRLRAGDQVGRRRDRAHGVRRERERDQPRPLGELGVERVDVERDVVRAHVDPPHGRARVAGRQDPRPDVRVVVQARHDDLVAGPQGPGERSRDVQQQARRVLAEHDLVTGRIPGSRRPPGAPGRSARRPRRSAGKAPCVFEAPARIRSWTAAITLSGACEPPGASAQTNGLPSGPGRASAGKRARSACTSREVVVCGVAIPGGSHTAAHAPNPVNAEGAPEGALGTARCGLRPPCC